MRLPQDIVKVFLEGELPEVLTAFMRLEGEYEEFEEDKEMVFTGIKIKFSLQQYIKHLKGERTTIKDMWKSNEINIDGVNYTTDEIFEELSRRRTVMERAVLEFGTVEDVLKSKR